jgi:hypothetical protein
MRGGCWAAWASPCRSAYRNVTYFNPGLTGSFLNGGHGFRLAMTLSPMALTVVSGTGGGAYAAGTAVFVTADSAPAGQVFSHWTVDPSGADIGVSFNAMESSTTVTMPPHAVTLTANYVDAPFNNPPDKPTLLSPDNGATAVSLTPTLEASEFSDPDPGDTHSGSRWMIINAAGTEIVWDSGIGAAATSVQVPENTLEYSTEYGWSVFYYDSQMETYSTGPLSFFTTMADPAADTTPPTVTITSPTSAATWTSPNATMNIGGTASDNVGVTSVKVRNFRDVEGYDCALSDNTDMPVFSVMDGNWTCYSLPLFQGQNRITVTAYDAAGNSATDTITVTYNGDTFYTDVLRSSTLIQHISMPDNLTPGQTVTVQWSLLSYLPIRSILGTRGDSDGVTLLKNGVFAGVTNSTWRIGERYASKYSFEAEYTVPQRPGDITVWFSAAQMDGNMYMSAVIPDGVDPRPHPTTLKALRRTILPGGTDANPQSDSIIWHPEHAFETSLNDYMRRSGGTLAQVSIPDGLVPGTQVTCEWKVLSYVNINSMLILYNLADRERLLLVEGTRIGNPVNSANWRFTHSGTTYYAREYTFRGTFTVPNEPGDQQIYFVNQESANTDSAWMAANIPVGVDSRPVQFEGMFGRFIERTIDP